MRGSWRTLMCSLKPSLQQRSYKIRQGQQISTNISRFTNNSMLITSRRQLAISIPTISMYFAISFNALFNRWYQTLSRSIFDLMQADASWVFAFIFNRNYNQGFALSSSTPFSRTWASNIGFIHLHRTHQAVATGTDHRNTQFMQQSPCCFVSIQSQNLLKSQGTDPMFLADHLPYSSKPQTQWYSRIFKDRARRNRNSIFTLTASIQSVFHKPAFWVTTAWTDKSIWPSHLIKILSTRFFSRKALFRLKHRLRVVFHNPHILYIGGRSVKRITINLYMPFSFEPSVDQLSLGGI